MAGLKLGEFGGQLEQPIPSEATQYSITTGCVERVETIPNGSTPKRVEAPSQRKLR